MKPRPKTLAIAATGTANLASVLALCARTGVEALITTDPGIVADADYALLPGVGAFGPAMKNLRSCGMDQALTKRWLTGKPLMGICLGMQMMCQESEEAPGVPGLGFIPVKVQRFAGNLPLPQLGWNSILPNNGSILKPGWAYFANSFRVKELPDKFELDSAKAGAGRWVCSQTRYGETFIASIEFYANESENPERPSLLLCQFHPELSGSWGQALFMCWMGLEENIEKAVIPGANSPEIGAIGASTAEISAPRADLKTAVSLSEQTPSEQDKEALR